MMAILTRPEELVAGLAERLNDRYQISLGLLKLGSELQSVQTTGGIREARRQLQQKASELQAAFADVTATIERLRDLEEIVRFTELGWPSRRDEIAESCKTDPQSGLSVWLDDWFTAVAALRIDAATRLLSMEESLPAGTDMLVRRCRAATEAVLSYTWDVGAPLLLAGARGIDVGAQTVPRDSTRRDLWVFSSVWLWRATARSMLAGCSPRRKRHTTDGSSMRSTNDSGCWRSVSVRYRRTR